MLLLLVFVGLIQLSLQQCLIAKDEIRKLDVAAHDSLAYSELQFSTDLLRAAANLDPKGNLLISPSSVFQASMLTYFISAKQTEKSLRKALHLDPRYDKLDLVGAYNLEKYYKKLRGTKSQYYKLSSANRFYYAKDLSVPYCMKVLFSEELLRANFQRYPDRVRSKINQWVAELTRHVIKDFLSEDAISQVTQLVLVNAAYFEGKWKSPFNEQDTYNGTFHLNNGTKIKIPMMNRNSKDIIHILDKELGVEAVELPYVGEDISMLVMLPLETSPSAVQDLLTRLDGKSLSNLVQGLSKAVPKAMEIFIPKFTMESELDLTGILESVGVGDLFHESGDLSTLSPELRGISHATHKAKINVDEKGTEAAAATSLFSTRMGTEMFSANRPFLYSIYDRTAKIPLFLGVFNHPEKNAS